MPELQCRGSVIQPTRLSDSGGVALVLWSRVQRNIELTELSS
ncbi:hypothetical protein SynBIOSU31_01136 [Synechococcus sp. BIOS-U3-1]|nr:hypothetical protein SynBIOSU31_01136 [Synechococcus sp. BIOS-U3-1]